ncbi:MAG: HAMP domain-containing sensor histidine kinase [Candidatus Thiodiazotropha sp.]
MPEYIFNPGGIIEAYVRKSCNLLIFDTINEQIVWCTNSDTIDNDFNDNEGNFQQLLTGLKIGKDNRDNFREYLLKYLNNESKESSFIDTTNVIHLELINQRYLFFRTESTQSKDLAYSRYLHDRENLLFTSRSISVSEMASTLAHEINQPIGTITNLLNGIKSRIILSSENNKEILGALQQAVDQSMFVSNIISRVRDYTQSRQPKKDLVNINLLLSKCVSLMDWEIKNTQVEITTLFSLSDISVLGDELMLQQVIINLIRNGIDATCGTPSKVNTITVTSSIVDNYVRISIKDSGKGMNDEEAQSLFIPFASNKLNGMGIGLNICRTFIELHMGKLWLTRNEGSGCTSHIMLPIST